MKVLWVAFVWPEPNSSAAGFRTATLLDVLKADGHDVRICSPCTNNTYQDLLEAKGFATATIGPNDDAFDDYLASFGPEIVFFDRFMIEEQFGWRVRTHVPAAIRILDTVDLQSLRRTREASVMKGPGVLQAGDEGDLQSDTALREIAAIFRSDLTLVVSDAERVLLLEQYSVPEYLIRVCSFMYQLKDSVLPFEERNDFVAIGNFNHRPNADSFRILHSEIWPRIKQIRNVQAGGEVGEELHIYGAYPTKEFVQLDNHAARFRVLGRAEDAIETLSRYRVNLAPLRFGAGIKGKISDGWVAGTPCVATKVAAEGMQIGSEFGGIIANTWDEFAEAAALLYLDRTKWSAAQKSGLKIVSDRYKISNNARVFLDIVSEAVARRDKNRTRNTIGRILWHHMYRSTEYFSRWISAKNQRIAKEIKI